MKVEGKNQVQELLQSDAEIEKILILDGTKDIVLRKIQKFAHEKQVKVEFVNKKVLKKFSGTEHHQGVIAFTSEFKYSNLINVLARHSADETSLYLILDEISDPHNLGAIIRVAECAGVIAVIIPNRRSATVNETVMRISAGATAHTEVVKVSNINYAIEELKNAGVWVYAMDMGGESIYRTKFSGKIALVIGNEGSGVKQLTKKLCDGIVSIPMFGKVNSLNASVSAGIGVFEVVRQISKF